MTHRLTDSQRKRYSRQLVIPEIGESGQEKLLAAKALVIGVGGLGSPCATYLAAAGVGTLGIVDSDTVDLSNLQRQILHHTADVGRPKTQSAGEKLRAINPEVVVVPHVARFQEDNARELIADYDVIVDASDNFATKFLINDVCVAADKPLCHGAVHALEGQAITILPGQTACYRCLFPEPPPEGAVPTPQEAGVLGTVPGVIGVIQANEALKVILGYGELLTDKLLFFDSAMATCRTLSVQKDESCPVCGDPRPA